MVKVKICGTTTLEDALKAVEYGADALGFIFYEKSSRYIMPDDARAIINGLPPFVTTVGVFVNETAGKINEIKRATGIDAVQLHGDELPADCDAVGGRVIKAFRVRDRLSAINGIKGFSGHNLSALLLDAHSESGYGGTGRTFDWEVVDEAKGFGRVILAGGLTPDNVSEAVDKVKPYAVDVASGVEELPGKKDLKKVKEFIERAKRI